MVNIKISVNIFEGFLFIVEVFWLRFVMRIMQKHQFENTTRSSGVLIYSLKESCCKDMYFGYRNEFTTKI